MPQSIADAIHGFAVIYKIIAKLCRLLTVKEFCFIIELFSERWQNMKKFRVISFIIAVAVVFSLLSPVTFAANEYPNTYANTGNYRKDIIGVAATQLGYREGSNNDTKYGDWYGLPNNPWCAMFVSWCANQAGIPTTILKKSSVASPGSSYFDIDYYGASEYTPVPGDLFFTKSFSHVGLVYSVDGNYFYSLEGNSNGSGSNEGDGVVSIRRSISNYYYGVPEYGKGHTLMVQYHANGGKIQSNGKTYDQYKVLSTDGINMRADAGTSYNVVTALPMNTVFTVTETKESDGYTWGKTTFDNQSGWCVISMNWTQKIGTVSDIPYYLDARGMIYETKTQALKSHRLTEDTHYTDLFPDSSDLGLIKEGYTFSGWVTAPFEGKFFAKGSSATAELLHGGDLNGNSKMVLYAVWMPETIHLQYHANGGSIDSGTYHIDSNLLYKGDASAPYRQKWMMGETKANGLVNASSMGLFKRGYTFKGWGTRTNGQKIFDQDQKLSAEALYAEAFNGSTVATLYAIWEPNTLRVQYHTNGGTITSDTYQAMDGAIYQKSTNGMYRQKWTFNQPKTNGLINPSTFGLKRSGYSCIGWSTAKSGGKVLHMDDPTMLPTDLEPGITSAGKTITLYAIWVESSHTHQYKDYIYNFDATDSVDGTETGHCSCGAIHRRTKANTKLKNSSVLFSDIPENAWYGHSMDYAITYELLSGTGDGRMQPQKAMNRAEFVQLLANLSGVDLSVKDTATEFSDVPATAWYAPAIKWASENGIVSGTGKGTFEPLKPITREQMCSILSRYAKNYCKITLPQNDDTALFTDDRALSSWAKADVYLCKRAEIISGVSENEFSPRSVATRASVSSMISRFHAEYIG